MLAASIAESGRACLSVPYIIAACRYRAAVSQQRSARTIASAACIVCVVSKTHNGSLAPRIDESIVRGLLIRPAYFSSHRPTADALVVAHIRGLF